MADVLVDSQRHVVISGYGNGLHPQLIGVLDQIDLRLRQLEEHHQQQHRPPSSHAADHGAAAPAPTLRRAAPSTAQHQHTKSLPAALQHVQARGDLMDRLNLLESRIRQVSYELGLDVAGGKAAVHHHHQFGLGLGLGSSSSSVPPVEDPAMWSDSTPVAVVDPAFGGGKVRRSKSVAADGRSWSAVEILQRGARQLHRSTSSISGISKPNTPTKVNKLKGTTKCASQKEKEKTKAERSNKSLTSRLWLMVGSGCKP